ncbi:putative heat shock protein [Erwinia phage vB_EamM_Phobos]|uniref:putative heat shock protein n=1 Tax=Erwinia phage vB_EamM_Phobos TaxID=1883377 RepID=UPI00081C33C6|nr:putative heat shock protein [Erwinia phage vB_EamM_Phobos]ANZ50320.1 putative heat shock protein [Erwinia phage vB_EamM_Phobos]
MKGSKGIRTPVEMVEIFDKSVRGQHDAKRMLAVAIANRHRRTKLSAEDRKFIKKQNILIEGPTGSGKTALMRVLREDFGLPVLEVDITEYSETGYHGKSVADMIGQLSQLDFTVPKWFKEKPEVKEVKKAEDVKLTANSSFDSGTKDKDTARKHLIVSRILLIGLIAGRVYSNHALSDAGVGSMIHKTVEDYGSENPAELINFFQRGCDLVDNHEIPILADSTAFIEAAARAIIPFEESGDKDRVPTPEFFARYKLEGSTVNGLLGGLMALDVADINALWDVKTPVEEIEAWPKVALAGEKNGFYRERLKAAMTTYFFRSLIAGMLRNDVAKVTDHASRTMAMQKYNGKDMTKEVTTILSSDNQEEKDKLLKYVKDGMPVLCASSMVSLSRGFRSWTNALPKLKLTTKSELLFPPKVTAAWDELIDMTFETFWDLTTKDFQSKTVKQVRDDVNNGGLLFAPSGDTGLDNDMPWNRRPPMGGIPGLGMMFNMGGGANVTGDSKEFLENFAVVFIDEIDKLIQASDRSDDVSRIGVQRGLLKLVEGGVYSGIDTSNILFVGAGAFSGTTPSKLLPELVGRFPIRARLKALTHDDYKAICQLSKSAFNMYLKMLETDGVKVIHDDDTFGYIAQITELENQEFNLGARRIEAIIERVFEPAMFEPEKFLEHGFDIRGETLRKSLRG